MDTSIREVTIAEHAEQAALTAINTFEHVPNPHEPGSPAAAKWDAAYQRYLLKHSAPQDVECTA